jgi:hypothetical protein
VSNTLRAKSSRSAKDSLAFMLRPRCVKLHIHGAPLIVFRSADSTTSLTSWSSVITRVMCFMIPADSRAEVWANWRKFNHLFARDLNARGCKIGCMQSGL